MRNDKAYSRLVAGDANLAELFDKADFDAVAVFLAVSYLNDNAIELGIGDGSELWHEALETCAMIEANPYTTRERLGVDAAMAEAAAAADLDTDESALLLEGIVGESLRRIGVAYDLEGGRLTGRTKAHWNMRLPHSHALPMSSPPLRAESPGSSPRWQARSTAPRPPGNCSPES